MVYTRREGTRFGGCELNAHWQRLKVELERRVQLADCCCYQSRSEIVAILTQLQSIRLATWVKGKWWRKSVLVRRGGKYTVG